ncbi:MAG: peptidoglycan-binding domain-containing protein, partial [Patescibacteria group bacterium]
YGLVGPKTRAKLQEVFGAPAVPAVPAVPITPSAPAVPVSVSAVFNKGLGLGTSNSDVKRLQQLLNSDSDTKISSSGAGSAGNESEYFGSLTAKAVQKFQVKYGLAKEGDTGYGLVGPKTRAKLQEVFGAAPAVAAPTAPIAPAIPALIPVPTAPVTPVPAPTPAQEVPFWLKLTPTPQGGAQVYPPSPSSPSQETPWWLRGMVPAN